VTYKDKMVSMAPATNMAPERPASDHASKAAMRQLIDPAALLPLLSRHHYFTALPSPERYDNRYEEWFPEQMPFARTSYHHNWVVNLLRVEAGCVAP
jgi:hypothetical protein